MCTKREILERASHAQHTGRKEKIDHGVPPLAGLRGFPPTSSLSKPLQGPPPSAGWWRPMQLLIFHYVSSCHALVRNHIADNLARCDWPAKCRESPRTTAAKKSPHCSQGIKCQRVTPKKHQLLNQLQWLVLLLPVSAPLSLPALVASSPLSSATVLRLPLRTLPLLLLTPVPAVRETRTLAPVVPVLFVTAPERVRLTSLTLNEHVSGYITGFN